ncbi:galactose-3-O-sulfotransferase 2-like [Pecten maximus]|uniref:galactose-3-O-sulfotransferase 2-like n=1 Tax=Pecten maximus TaxID=6579 RepID=UPI001457F7B9|nr:galactose-3-O-sulfotransferase 2-like [Pecten maximus]
MAFSTDSSFKLLWKTDRKLLTYGHRDSTYEPQISPQNLSNHSRYIRQDRPANHIAFLKIHKAASTTVANIFLRYGYEKNLVMAVPKGLGGGGPSLSPRYFYPPPENGTYDISCAHVPYNREDFSKVLPKDTIYIGIVREPFSLFRSFIHFFRPKNVVDLPGENPVLKYLSNNEKPVKFERYTVARAIDRMYDLNMMANEFGFPKELFFKRDETVIQSYLRKLDKEMDIVLVVEYLDESLVMMRRILNWDLRHVLYGSIHINKRQYPRLKFGSTEKNLFKVKSYLDYALYDYFLLKFQDNLKRQHSDFYEEVAYFRKTRMIFDNFCKSAKSGRITRSTLSFEGSEWNRPFVLTVEHCKWLYISGVTFYNRIITEQGLRDNCNVTSYISLHQSRLFVRMEARVESYWGENPRGRVGVRTPAAKCAATVPPITR